MAKINLKSNEMSNRKPRSQGSNKSLLFGILTLALGLAVFGMVRYLTIKTESQNEEARAEITQIENQMNSEEVKKLYDFQDRLIEIEKLMVKKNMQSAVLSKIERHTLAGTVFKKLDFETQSNKTQVEATVIVDNHNELAKQIEAFTLIDEVQDAYLDSSKVSKEGSGIEGKIVFFVQDVK